MAKKGGTEQGEDSTLRIYNEDGLLRRTYCDCEGLVDEEISPYEVNNPLPISCCSQFQLVSICVRHNDAPEVNKSEVRLIRAELTASSKMPVTSPSIRAQPISEGKSSHKPIRFVALKRIVAVRQSHNMLSFLLFGCI